MNAYAAVSAAILATISGTSAFAVTMARCPSALRIQVGRMLPADEGTLRKQGEQNGNYKELVQARAVVMAARIPARGAVTLHLTRRSNSECGYHPAWDSKRSNDTETRLFTRGGRDILRYAMHLGAGEPVWTYFNVESYAPTGIAAEIGHAAAPVLAIFDHGAPRFAVAWITSAVAR